VQFARLPWATKKRRGNRLRSEKQVAFPPAYRPVGYYHPILHFPSPRRSLIQLQRSAANEEEAVEGLHIGGRCWRGLWHPRGRGGGAVEVVAGVAAGVWRGVAIPEADAVGGIRGEAGGESFDRGRGGHGPAGGDELGAVG